MYEGSQWKNIQNFNIWGLIKDRIDLMVLGFFFFKWQNMET